MANLKQSKKRARQDIKKHIINKRNLSIVKTSIKKFLKLVNSNFKELAYTSYTVIVAKIDKCVAKGIFHKNKGSRLKSNLNNKLKLKFINNSGM